MKRILALLFASLLLSACGSDTSTHHDYFPTDSFDIESVSLNCPSGDCPQGVGILIVSVRTWMGTGNFRCTATLVKPTQILTNGHCDAFDKAGVTGRWFVLPQPGGGKEVIPVVSRAFKEGPDDKSAGRSRDIAVLNLGRAASHTPRAIAREIPTQMENLVTYVVNARTRGSNHDFNLDKKICPARARIPLTESGYLDRGIGISLGCRVIGGNSGAPVFRAGDLDEVQAIVHTQWPFANGDEVFMRVRANYRRFFLKDPAWINTDYGMGERVHCTEIPGFAPPKEQCKFATFERTVDEPFRQVVRAEVERWLQTEGVNARASGIEWTLEPLNGTFAMSAEDKVRIHKGAPGAILVPKPLCKLGSLVKMEISVPVIRLGFMADEGVGVQQESPRRMLAHFDAMGAVFTQIGDGSFLSALFANPLEIARNDNSKFRVLANAVYSALPACEAAGSAERARDLALKAVANIKSGGPEFENIIKPKD